MDEKSRVRQLKKLERNYTVLEFLSTKPRLTYLAKVRNPNRAMPDYYEMPLSLQEYSAKMGNPLEPHGGGGHAPEPASPGPGRKGEQ
jgi:molybdopterin-containing oxidoreductase family iron-sulfur binding subunit